MPSSSKTFPDSVHEGSVKSCKTLPTSGLMLRGQLTKRTRQVSQFDVRDSLLWPAPKARDGTGSRQLGYDNPSFNKGLTLTDAMLVYHNQPVGKGITPTMVLNPDFVERLMGIPEGWTHVDDERASALLVTPSARRKR